MYTLLFASMRTLQVHISSIRHMQHFLGLSMWSDRSFACEQSIEIDLEDEPSPPAPHMLPLPSFVECADDAAHVSDSSGTSMRYTVLQIARW